VRPALSATVGGCWNGMLPRSCHKYLEHSLGFKQPSALLSNEHSVEVWELTEIKWNG
jgi:hypothetical protein